MGTQKPGFLRKDALGPAHGRKKPSFEESECDRELSLLFGDWKSIYTNFRAFLKA